MAHAGIGSRRSCEDMIKQGRVTVNGTPAQLGQKVDPRKGYNSRQRQTDQPRRAPLHHGLQTTRCPVID